MLRLWRLLPVAADALLAHSHGLVDTLLSGAALVERLAWLPDGEHWQQRLAEVTRRTSSAPLFPDARQDLFDQVTRWICAIAQHQPLILWLDDIHWADRGTLALFFHLCQKLAGYPVLIVSTYRPEEIAAAEGREAQKFAIVSNELHLHSHSITLDLDRSDGRAFVSDYLEAVPHDFAPSFAATLYVQGSGHALFTVELVQYMQEQGLLVREPRGYWTTTPNLNWGQLPVRVEAVIGERLTRLPAALHSLLTAAAIQGEHFTAEIVARALVRDSAEVVHLFSAELGRRHRLTLAVGIDRAGEQQFAHYRFRHALFRHYRLNHPDASERI